MLRELRLLLVFLAVFLFFYFFPLQERVLQGVKEALYLTHDYAKEHIVFCLLPALFIAGAISTFLSEASVMKYLGPSAPRYLSYGVASVSGAILAVCSCTVLPLFAGIYFRGGGIGPATTFLYSGPAINVLAIVLTAKILGLELGLGRMIFAIFGSILIGLLMELFFRKEEKTRLEEFNLEVEEEGLSNYQRILPIATLIGLLVSATWSGKEGLAGLIFTIKWPLVLLFGGLLALQVIFWLRVSPLKLLLTAFLIFLAQILFQEKEISFLMAVLGFSWALSTTKGEAQKWFESTYLLGKQILPLLLIGVFVAGFFLGRPGQEGFIPSIYVSSLLGGNSFWANLFASLAGMLMYFATLTEVPIIQGLLGAGMGYGPALALLLSGPSVSLPSLLVLNRLWGAKKTLTYTGLILILNTLIGYLFGIMIKK